MTSVGLSLNCSILSFRSIEVCLHEFDWSINKGLSFYITNPSRSVVPLKWPRPESKYAFAREQKRRAQESRGEVEERKYLLCSLFLESDYVAVAASEIIVVNIRNKTCRATQQMTLYNGK